VEVEQQLVQVLHLLILLSMEVVLARLMYTALLVLLVQDIYYFGGIIH
jgi:hypothetical protein